MFHYATQISKTLCGKQFEKSRTHAAQSDITHRLYYKKWGFAERRAEMFSKDNDPKVQNAN